MKKNSKHSPFTVTENRVEKRKHQGEIVLRVGGGASGVPVHSSRECAQSEKVCVKSCKSGGTDSARRGRVFFLLFFFTHVVLLKSFCRVGYSGIFRMSSQSLSENITHVNRMRFT